jgi:hypothetical protein
VAELRGAGDAPEDGDASARRFAADAGNHAGELRPRYEPSPRAEYADVIRQNTAEANAQADASQVDTGQVEAAEEDADQTETTREVGDHANAPPDEVSPDDAGQSDSYPDEADPEDAGPEDAGPEDVGQADTDPGEANHAGADPEDAGETDSDQAETDRRTEGSIADALERFDPRRAGLPEVSHAEAAAYIEEHQAERPWLATARDCSPDAQRVFVALDQGQGHAQIRHDGWVTEEMNQRRVRDLEDPAQLDPAKREAGIDGLATGDLPHRCGEIVSRVTDPEIFAAAFARGVKHPDVRAALDSTGPRPDLVTLPISSVLGDDGHKFCAGWRLEPVNGSMDDARANRRAWAAGDHTGPEPQVRPVETFEGGTVTFAFRRSTIGGYEVSTMYVNPSDEQST